MNTAPKTVKWTCTAAPGWEWLGAMANPPGSGNPLPGFPTAKDGTRTGTISLPSNSDYWHSCMGLILQGTTTGNTFLRYFTDDQGNDCLQAYAVAQGEWASSGLVGTGSNAVSSTDSEGGFSLVVQFA